MAEIHNDLEGDGDHIRVVSPNGVGAHCRIPEPARDEHGAAAPGGSTRNIHRIGGGSVENLRLKPAESQLKPPGISVLKGGTPTDAAEQMKVAFPTAAKLHELTKTVGSAAEEGIRAAGFDVMPDPTRRFANHHHVIHPDGVVGFVDDNLALLSEAFTNTVLGR
jgi:hypothetical protein